MGLIETLTASGRPQSRRSERFFNSHPELVDEIQDARAAGWTWRQIAQVLRQDYDWPLGEEALRRFVGRL